LLVTPNTDEAASLTGLTIRTSAEVEKAAGRIHEMGPRYVLVKGGHLEGDEATDTLFDGKSFSHFGAPRLNAGKVHGTGCVLSAALTGYLALGKPVEEAVQLGKEFVTNAIKGAVQVGKGIPACNPGE
jgi:hydroxymethylpyrimidine/phosphomethylpyrimidine kinase